MKKYFTTVIEANDRYDPWGSKCFNLSVEKEFDNYDDAVVAAKKTAAKTKEDVTIYTVDSVVKFPVGDYTVEKVV